MNIKIKKILTIAGIVGLFGIFPENLHAAEAQLENLSDEELLELQEAIQAELMLLINDLDVLLSRK